MEKITRLEIFEIHRIISEKFLIIKLYKTQKSAQFLIISIIFWTFSTFFKILFEQSKFGLG